jgi:hypothetical protein
MDICKISTTYIDQNYRTMTILAVVAAIPGAAFAALQLCAPLAGNAAKFGDVLTCIAFLVLSLSLRLHRSGRRNVFILDAISSLALAFTFTVCLTGLLLHPSTTGDAGEASIYIFPAILLFLTHSFMALVQFQG